MREIQPFSGQQINNTAKRSNRQQFGQNRRIVNTKIADFGVADYFLVGLAQSLNIQASRRAYFRICAELSAYRRHHCCQWSACAPYSAGVRSRA